MAKIRRIILVILVPAAFLSGCLQVFEDGAYVDSAKGWNLSLKINGRHKKFHDDSWVIRNKRYPGYESLAIVLKAVNTSEKDSFFPTNNIRLVTDHGVYSRDIFPGSSNPYIEAGQLEFILMEFKVKTGSTPLSLEIPEIGKIDIQSGVTKK